MNSKALQRLAAAALALAAGVAQADTVDFDTLARTLRGRDLGKTFVDEGFTFESKKAVRDPSVLFDADPHGETLSDLTGAALTIDRTDGAAFDLVSLDLADALDLGLSGTVKLSYVADGARHTEDLVLDRSTGLQTFALGIDDVTSVRLTGAKGAGFQIDNLVATKYVPVAVPESGALALVAAGFGMLATFVRRRRA